MGILVGIWRTCERKGTGDEVALVFVRNGKSMDGEKPWVCRNTPMLSSHGIFTAEFSFPSQPAINIGEVGKREKKHTTPGMRWSLPTQLPTCLALAGFSMGYNSAGSTKGRQKVWPQHGSHCLVLWFGYLAPRVVSGNGFVQGLPVWRGPTSVAPCATAEIAEAVPRLSPSQC